MPTRQLRRVARPKGYCNSGSPVARRKIADALRSMDGRPFQVGAYHLPIGSARPAQTAARPSGKPARFRSQGLRCWRHGLGRYSTKVGARRMPLGLAKALITHNPLARACSAEGQSGLAKTSASWLALGKAIDFSIRSALITWHGLGCPQGRKTKATRLCLVWVYQAPDRRLLLGQ